MIQDNYKQVLTVKLLHNYYENGLCNGAILQPDATTQQLFKRFNFLAKKTGNGIELYTSTTSTITDLLAYITQTTGTTAFRFAIIISEPFFQVITQLPINLSGKMIYDTQRGTARDGNFYLDGTFSPARTVDCAGELTVHFNDISYQPFAIAFQARSTRWQYYIINKTLFSLNNLSIQNFSDPVSVVTENGNNALLFSSQTLIPFSQSPTFRLDLMQNNKTLYKGLPFPDPAHFGWVHADNERQMSSPMYVYL